MLTQKKVRSRKDAIMLVVMIFALALSVYLVYVNVNYFVSRSKLSKGFDADVMSKVSQADDTYKNIEWEFLGSNKDVLEIIQKMGLQTRNQPLLLDSIVGGRINVFTRIN